ncbi:MULTISPECIES: CcdB family protein [Erwiniaceae]|uniref:CcdB family protein n=1 Tax=Enterobacter agglomerans TaxID=549 RepID=A0ACC5RMF4_ENTAG|nr:MULTISPECIES: CcdB family protein [Erwiniaceae]MBK4725642.1 CcdB family protein [Pantoea agglomerans]MBP2153407.1 toxin CcdB [Erwinia rhapontici]
MEQFSVYQNHGKNRQAYPYFINIQSDLLSHLTTRLVMPLARKQASNSQVRTLTPVLHLEEHDYVILTTMLTTTDVKNLRDQDRVANASDLRDDIVAAVDLLVLGI